MSLGTVDTTLVPPPRPRWTEDDWLTRADAAAHCRCSRATISRACRQRKLRYAKINGGRVSVFRLSWLDKWQERNVVEPLALAS